METANSTAHVRWVQQPEFDALEAKRIKETHEAILALLRGNGRPPYITSFHMRLGKIVS